MTQKWPLVVVFGATACGKSKLAIQLASRFGGEIISADSIQVYSGLDIVTNKVTQEERRQAKHHLIDFLEPQKQFSVTDFRNKALKIIDGLQSQDKLPIVVGGTNYYIESVIWKKFLLGPMSETVMAKRAHDEAQSSSDTEHPSEGDTMMDSEGIQAIRTAFQYADEDLEDVDKFFSRKIYQKSLMKLDNEKLWKLLEKVDPKSAHLIHMNDKRKVVRYLQVIQERRRSYSEILDDINKTDGDKVSLGGSLRYNPTCVLWLSYPEMATLNKVMDDRVDQMINRGLLAELEQFHKRYNEQRIRNSETPNYKQGIFQSIGFKEFHDYLILDESEKESEKGKALLQKSILDMKVSTRRFARDQLKWIEHRFLRPKTRDLPMLFKFESTTDDVRWQKDVLEPAQSIVECLREGRCLDSDLLGYKQEPELGRKAVKKPAKYYCEDCDRTIIGSDDIEAHLKGRRHERTKRAKLRLKSDADPNSALPEKELNRPNAI